MKGGGRHQPDRRRQYVLLFLSAYLTLAVLMLVWVGTASAESRDPKVVRAFRATHPCPATGKMKGACGGWVVDHAYPLCAGGKDAVENMVWQDVKGSYIKDRIERELCACKKKGTP